MQENVRPEKGIVVGAGIAGLGTAIALARQGVSVTVIDRDPPPGSDDPDRAFAEWPRRGVAQFRHSHVFLARLYVLLRDHYPELLATLLQMGARKLPFSASLPPQLLDGYDALAADDDFTLLSSRRVTLELAMRRFAAAQPGIEIVPDCRVQGLVLSPDSGIPEVSGVRIGEGEKQELRADFVIDASGRTSPFPDLLRKAGARIAEESAPAGIVYFTRHYRLRPGRSEPPRGGAPSVADLGYLKFGVFRADNGWFSVTLAVPEIEDGLRALVRKAAGFDAVCAQLPGVSPWTDRACAEPMGDVYAMGGLDSLWRHYMRGPRPVVRNFFAVGDAVIRSNPLYGRGCSAGFLQGHLLARVIAQTSDPLARAQAFYAAQMREIRPYYDIMVKQDAQAIRRAERARDPDYQPRFRTRVARHIVEQAIGPASRADITVFRALMRGFHMLEEDPRAALRDPAIVSRILRIWARGPRRNRDLAERQAGPDRATLFARVALAGS